MDGVQVSSLQGSITQAFTLSSTQPVTVSFNWAGAQQAGFTGANTEQLRVSLCGPGQTPGNANPGNAATPGGPTGNSCTAYTNVLSNTSMGFTGWQNAGTPNTSFTFNPISTAETLMFTAIGTPNDRLFPPFVLLDGITVTQGGVGAPEPATFWLLGIGLAVMAVVAYRRRKSVRVPGSSRLT